MRWAKVHSTDQVAYYSPGGICLGGIYRQKNVPEISAPAYTELFFPTHNKYYLKLDDRGALSRKNEAAMEGLCRIEI
jgi:hypothetical protein